MSIEIMIVTIVIACIISPIILAVTISKANKIIQTQKKETYTAHTNGTVTKVKNKIITISYEVDKEKYEIKETLKNKNLKNGDTIKIKYNPSFPSDASIENTKEEMKK